MKKTGTILGVCLALCVMSFTYSCKKNDSNSTPDFSISGVQNLTLQQDSIRFLVLDIVPTAGVPDVVTLNVMGIPAHVKAEWGTQQAMPHFHSNLFLTEQAGAVAGTYPCTLTATSAHQNKSYNFNVVVQ